MPSPKLLATTALATAIVGAIGVVDAQTTVQFGADGTAVTTRGATGSAQTAGPDGTPGAVGSGSTAPLKSTTVAPPTSGSGSSFDGPSNGPGTTRSERMAHADCN